MRGEGGEIREGRGVLEVCGIQKSMEERLDGWMDEVWEVRRGTTLINYIV